MHFYWAQLHLSVNNQHTALHLDYFPMKMVATVLFESSKIRTPNKIRISRPSNLCSVGDLKYSKPIKDKVH